MRARSLVGRLGLGLAFGFLGAGCAEHQFLLSVRNPEPIIVTGTTEPVSRLRTPAPTGTSAAVLFPDRGVLLQSGTELTYWHEGDWISSVEPVRVAENGGRIAVDFTLHPGRRDLPLSLSTDRQNVCELRTRDRSNRALGWAGVVVGAMVGAFVPITALSHDEGTKRAAPFLGGAAAALLIGGAAWILWPAGPDQVAVAPSCASTSQN